MKQKEIFVGYPAKDKNGKNYGPPRVTVCLVLLNEETVARGRTICSFDDVPSEQEGQRRSRGRAKRAIDGKMVRHMLNNPKALSVLGKCKLKSDDFLVPHEILPIDHLPESEKQAAEKTLEKMRKNLLRKQARLAAKGIVNA